VFVAPELQLYGEAESNERLAVEPPAPEGLVVGFAKQRPLAVFRDLQIELVSHHFSSEG
jgi:hypothetical protein